MTRWFAWPAVVAGAAAFLPRLLDLAGFRLGLDFGLGPLLSLAGRSLGEGGSFVLSFILGPVALLWGLIAAQRTERGRWRVRAWAVGLCVAGAAVPPHIGLVLCLPVLACVLLPVMRRHRDASGMPGAGLAMPDGGRRRMEVGR